MFDDYGRPNDGYGQNSPFTDIPKNTPSGQPGRPPSPPQQSPLDAAIQPGGQPMTASAPNYPVDPQMQAFVQRPPGPNSPLAPAGQYRNTLSGFNYDKLSDPNHNSIKYVAGRVFEQYAPTPDNISKVVSDLNAKGIPAQQTGPGDIDFGDGNGPIDVLQNAHAGGGAWWWNPRGTGQPTTATGQISPLLAAIAGQQQQNNSQQQAPFYQQYASAVLGTP